MKKLLTLLAATIFATTVSINTVDCGHDGEQNSNDLSKLPKNINITLTNTTQTVGDYQLAVVKQLQQISGFNNLQLRDVNITKDNDTVLQDGDIKAGQLNIKITSKTLNFTKSKIILVATTIKKFIISLPRPANSIVFKNNDLYNATWDDRVYCFDISKDQPTTTAVVNLKTTANSIVINGNEIYAATQKQIIYKFDLIQKQQPIAFIHLPTLVNTICY